MLSTPRPLSMEISHGMAHRPDLYSITSYEGMTRALQRGHTETAWRLGLEKTVEKNRHRIAGSVIAVSLIHRAKRGPLADERVKS